MTILTRSGAWLLILAAPLLMAQAPEVDEAEAVILTETASGESAAAVVPGEVLTLEAAQQLALAQNPTLQAVAAVVSQAETRVTQARSLYFPQVDLNYTASHTELPENTVQAARKAALEGPIQGAFQQALVSSLFTLSIDPVQAGFTLGQGLLTGIQTRDSIDRGVDSYSLGLSASYILFNGFSRKYQNAIARFGARESESAYSEAKRLILFAVAESYYGVQLARENIGIAAADEGFNAKLLEEAKARRRQGAGSKSDVLNFEVLVRVAQAARINAERDYAMARIGLATLMGLPEGKLPDSVEVAALEAEAESDLSGPADEEQVALALSDRPDVNQARFALSRSGATVKERRSVYYPQVAAFASRDGQLGDNSRFEGDDFSSTVGVQVGYNLFSGGRNRARVKEAKFGVREAEARLAEAELGATSEVRQALVNLATSQQALVLQRDTTSYVEENRDLVEKEYDAGQTSLVRLNQAQRDLTEAQGRLAVARVALRLAWYQLRTSTGESLTLTAAE